MIAREIEVADVGEVPARERPDVALVGPNLIEKLAQSRPWRGTTFTPFDLSAIPYQAKIR